MHFHGHNDFGLATAAAVAAVRAGARWIQGTVNGMGERAGNANLPEIALALRGLYGVETNLRLDRVRAFAERLQELSGYELEPYKPLVGDNLFRRESGAVASQFHDPPAIEPYSSDVVAAQRGIVLGKKSGIDSIRIKAEELGLDLDDDAQRDLLARVKELGHEEAGRRHRRRVPAARAWLSTTPSSSAAGSTRSRAPRCWRARGWDVCVLEREAGARRRDQDGRADRARLRPRRLQRLASALGRRAGARGARRTSSPHAGSSTSTPSMPTATAFPDGEQRVPRPRIRTRTPPSSARRGRAAMAAVGAQAELVFGVLGTELWSRAGAGLGVSAYRRLGRRGLAAFGGEVVQSSRDWLETTFESERVARPAGALGAAHGARAGRSGVRAS